MLKNETETVRLPNEHEVDEMLAAGTVDSCEAFLQLMKEIESLSDLMKQAAREHFGRNGPIIGTSLRYDWPKPSPIF